MAAYANLEALEGRLGYEFKDRRLLERALTHSSARGRAGVTGDYERLEFLGDRVLGLAIAELLSERFPEAEEGVLARAFNRLVNRATCADVGRAMALDVHLVVGASESTAAGRGRESIIADACEAVLGAVFLDGGFEPARRIIRAFWGARTPALEAPRTDPKSALQEWAQGQGLALPDYVELERRGPDHAPTFTAEVRVEGFAPERGEGASKRAAEQDAAERLLRREGVWKSEAEESEARR